MARRRYVRRRRRRYATNPLDMRSMNKLIIGTAQVSLGLGVMSATMKAAKGLE